MVFRLKFKINQLWKKLGVIAPILKINRYLNNRYIRINRYLFHFDENKNWSTDICRNVFSFRFSLLYSYFNPEIFFATLQITGIA